MKALSHIKYAGALPCEGNEVWSINLVTNELEAGCRYYEVSEAGRLVRVEIDGTITDMGFSGMLHVMAANTDADGFYDWLLNFNEDGNFTHASEVPEYAYYSLGRLGNT